jgi:predicted Fe-S protein YdhL (DUF1289 family)
MVLTLVEEKEKEKERKHWSFWTNVNKDSIGRRIPRKKERNKEINKEKQNNDGLLDQRNYRVFSCYPLILCLLNIG